MMQLPQLIGSTGQVAWANQIRARVLRDIVEPARRTVSLSRARHESGSVPAAQEPPWPKLEAQHAEVLRACSKLESVTDAGWWIETRKLPGRTVILGFVMPNLPGWKPPRKHRQLLPLTRKPAEVHK